MTAPLLSIERVTVRCCRCDTVAHLRVSSLPTYRAQHVCKPKTVHGILTGASGGPGVLPVENATESVAPPPSIGVREGQW